MIIMIITIIIMIIINLRGWRPRVLSATARGTRPRAAIGADGAGILCHTKLCYVTIYMYVYVYIYIYIYICI